MFMPEDSEVKETEKGYPALSRSLMMDPNPKVAKKGKKKKK